MKKHFNSEIEVLFGTGQGNLEGGERHDDDKLTICRRHQAIYIIEDNPAEIRAFLKTKTSPLCLAWPWNKKLEKNKKIPRGDWKFLTKYILDKESL